MTDNHDSLIREVKEELEREKYARVWDKYGNYLIAAAAAIVLSVGGYKYWESATRAAVVGAGAQYETALGLSAKEKPSSEDTAKAEVAFKALALDGPGGYRTLGEVQVAASYAASGDKAAAVGAYDALAKRSGVDPVLRDFAILQAATLRVGDADWTEMENRLNALIEPTNAWRYSALQLLGISAFKAGKTDKAREAFEQLISNMKAPASIRERASLYMAKIVSDELANEASSGSSSEAPVVPAPSGEPGETGAEGDSADAKGATDAPSAANEP